MSDTPAVAPPDRATAIAGLLDTLVEASFRHGEAVGVTADSFAAEHAAIADTTRRKLDTALRALLQDGERWKEWALHQEWCRQCAEGDPDECSRVGGSLKRAARLSDPVTPSEERSDA